MSGDRADATDFLGRAHEVSVCSRLLGDAIAGQGAVLVVEGDAGIGKSRFLAHCLDMAQRAGCETRSAAASVLGTDRPFGLIADALSGDDDVIGRGGPPTSTTGPSDGPASGAGTITGDESGTRYRTVEALIDTVERLSLASPLVLALDDVQWADPSSAVALHALARRVGALPVLLLVAGRPPVAGSEHERLMAALAREGPEVLRLGPLDATSVEHMAEQALGASPGANLRRTLAGAAGNPFYVRAVLQGLERDGVLEFEGSDVDTPSPELPPTLQLTVLRGLQVLDVATRDALRLGAVLGQAFSLADLGLLSGQDPLEAWEVIQPALASGVVADQGDVLAFRHDLVREAIYADIPLPVRQELHARAARALAAAGRDPVTLAPHIVLGPAGPDPDGAAWLRSAAADTVASAPDSAAALLRRAIDLLPRHSPELRAMQLELLMALVWSARLDEGEELATALLQSGLEPPLAGRVHLGLGWALWIAGRTIDAARVFEGGAADPVLLPPDRARLAAFGAWIVCFQLGQAERGAPLAADAIRQGEAGGDDLALSMGLAARAASMYLRGEIPGAIAETLPLIARVEVSTSPELQRVGGHILFALTLVDGDEIERADDVLRRGRRASEEVGAASSLAIWHRTHALRHFAVGDWDDALAEVEAGLALASDTGSNLGSVAGLAIRALIAVRRGDLTTAERAVAVASETLRASGPEYRSHWTSWAAALLADARGEAAAALTSLRGAWADCEARGLAVDLPWLGPDLVRLALAAHDEALAASVATAVGRCPARAEVPSVGAAALRCRGLVEGDASVLLAAVAEARQAPRRPALADALTEAGDALVADGRPEEARAALLEAIDLYDQLGAVPGLARAESLLRRAGGRRGSRGSRARAATGWQSLTPSESRVAGLVAEGLTNAEIAERLFVSRRTVETHVARVLMKLGMRSRVQVVKAAAARPAGELPPTSGR